MGKGVGNVVFLLWGEARKGLGGSRHMGIDGDCFAHVLSAGTRPRWYQSPALPRCPGHWDGRVVGGEGPLVPAARPGCLGDSLRADIGVVLAPPLGTIRNMVGTPPTGQEGSVGQGAAPAPATGKEEIWEQGGAGQTGAPCPHGGHPLLLGWHVARGLAPGSAPRASRELFVPVLPAELGALVPRERALPRARLPGFRLAPPRHDLNAKCQSLARHKGRLQGRRGPCQAPTSGRREPHADGEPTRRAARGRPAAPGPAPCPAEGPRHGWAPRSARGQHGPGCHRRCTTPLVRPRGTRQLPWGCAPRGASLPALPPAQVPLARRRKQPERRRVDSLLSDTRAELSTGGEKGRGHVSIANPPGTDRALNSCSARGSAGPWP